MDSEASRARREVRKLLWLMWDEIFLGLGRMSRLVESERDGKGVE